MCGIEGIIIYGDGPPVSPEALRAMGDAMQHRGPDDEGQWISPDGRAGLGHQRLSIVDLSASGHQPMATRDGRYQIVFNGEIYNYLSLRKELEDEGFEFSSTSDTETLLHGYRHWGVGLLDRLRGMFAFAIYDAETHETFLARDSMGIKPLYVADDGNRIAFASEVQALKKIVDDHEVDPEGLASFLCWGSIAPPRTLHRAIAAMPSASWMSIRPGRVVGPEIYYRLEDEFGSPDKMDAEEAAEALRVALVDSVTWTIVEGAPGCGNVSGHYVEGAQFAATEVWGNNCEFSAQRLIRACRKSPAQPIKVDKSTEDLCKATSPGSVKDPSATNPVRISTGEKLQTELDYQAVSPSRLQFIRYYGSQHGSGSTVISPGWSHNYENKIALTTDSVKAGGFTYAVVSRSRNMILEFTRPNDASGWTTDADIKATLTSFPTYHELKLHNDSREHYNLNGQLISIIYKNGYQIDFTYSGTTNLLDTVIDNLENTLTLSYNAENKLSGLLTPDNRQFTYSYVDARLDKITNDGDLTSKSYIYDDPKKPTFLSGILDERGNRYATWRYNLNGDAVSGEHANGVEKVTFFYSADRSGFPQTIVTNSKNQATVYSFTSVLGIAASSDVAGPGCATCGTGDTSFTYDSLNGNLLTKTTKGITTEYKNYNANHNAQTITKAFGTPEAKITTYTFDPQYYSRVATKTEPSVLTTGNKVTTYSYDIFGNVTNVNTTGFTPIGTAVNRTIALQYNGPLNQLTEIDGPRPNTLINDITTLVYYPNTAVEGNNRARLKNISQGGILLRSNIQYTASGKVSSETRTNGLNISNTYYAGNDRLATYTETVAAKSRTTKLTYLPTGEVETITLADGTPDALTVTLGYDMARRLTSVRDAVNNRIEFVLDTESNITDKNVYDNNGATGVLKRTLHQVFDVYSRLESVTQANEVSGYTFDPDGTLSVSSIGDALANEKTESSYQYDGLKRLTSITQNTTGTDPKITNLLIQYGYDVNDKLTKVIDPKNGTTTYVYDDLGNLLSQTSPDTGLTKFVNDEAGNRTEQTDANNIILTYAYDGLNRIEAITGINVNDNITVDYDTCIGGVGRLCGFTDASGQTGYQYDGFGRTTDQSHTELGVSYNTTYAYNLIDRITQITLPSGRVVNKQYNTNAQVASIDATVAGTMSVVIDKATYAADGQLSDFTYGNGYTENRTFDMAGRITDQNMPKKPVVVADTTAPIVIPPINITTEASATLTSVTLGSATATDNVDGILTPTASNTGPYPLGLTTVTWNATDAAGSVGTATQTVTITDTTAPSITAPTNVSVISATSLAVTLGSPTTSDLFGPVTSSNDAPALFNLGSTVVTWTATDGNGNRATVTQTVTVTAPAADTIAPVVTAPLAVTAEATATLTLVALGTASASDNVDGTIAASASNTGPYPLGLTTVTWNATDVAGNVGTATQTVTITDTTAPSLTAPVNVSIISDVAIAVTLGSATTSDLFGPITTSNDAPALFNQGSTVVTWTASDANGNSSTATQTITVTATTTTPPPTGQDTIPPVVTSPANVTAEATSTRSNVVAIGTATAIDNIDGTLPAVPDITGPFEIGITIVTWTATDKAGNDGIAEQLIIVQDSTAPVITAPAAMTVISTVPVEINIGQATATDLFLSDIYHDAPKFFPLGTTTVTWTAIDDYGNTATTPQLVTVSPVAVNTIEPNQLSPLQTVALTLNSKNTATGLTNNSFIINPKHQSTVVMVMVSDEFGKTMPPKAWYQPVKQGRWKTLEASQVSNLKPDVMMVVSDTKIDLWQLNDRADGKTKSLNHQQKTFNGKAWALSQNLQQVNHVAWTPSQPDPAKRPEVNWSYAYDSRGNITTRTVDLTAQGFVYDALDRLTDDVFTNQVYGYDKNGNRVALSDNGTATTLVYDANTNRMNTNGANAVVLDSVGNTTSDGNHTYGYNDHNRLTSVDTNITYVYNALGQRTRKVTPSGTTIYHYDLDGLLISETDETGAPIKDYVYLDGQPIAQLSDVTGEPAVAYIHTDHLQTPRKVTDALGKVIWSWDSDAFGKLSADVDPDGDGSQFEMNLRFAGQYFDSESGLFYNYFRYYDPSTGRYITSDPIGLYGGLNTYGYVGGNPLYWIDPYGLTAGTAPTHWGGTTRIPWGRIITLFPRSPTAILTGILWGIPNQNTGNGECPLGDCGPQYNQEEETDPKKCPPKGKDDKKNSPDRQALNDLITDATNGGRKPLSGADADTILDWANELGIGGARDDRGTGHWEGGDHVHVPGSGIPHIPAND